MKYKSRLLKLGIFSFFMILLCQNSGLLNVLLINIGRVELSKAYLNIENVDHAKVNNAIRFFSIINQGHLNDRRVEIEKGRAHFLVCNYDEARKHWIRFPQYTYEQAYTLHLWVVKIAPYTCNDTSGSDVAISIWPDFPQVYYHLGSTHFSEKDFANAIPIFEDATQAKYFSNFPRIQTLVYYNLARSYHALHNIQKAEENYLQVIQVDPMNRFLWFAHAAYIYLSRFAMDRGDYLQSASFLRNGYQAAISEKGRSEIIQEINQLIQNTSQIEGVEEILADIDY